MTVSAPSHNVSEDVEKFNEEITKINQTMAELDILFQDKQLPQILQNIPQLIKFQKNYENMKYLINLEKADEHEQFIYEIYEPVLKLAATSFRPFTDFSQINYDSLTRLKWRWLGKKLAPKYQGQLEEAKNELQPNNIAPANQFSA